MGFAVLGTPFLPLRVWDGQQQGSFPASAKRRMIPTWSTGHLWVLQDVPRAVGSPRKKGRGSTGQGASQLERLSAFGLGAVRLSVISRRLRTGYPAEVVLEGLAVGSCLGNKGCEVFLPRTRQPTGVPMSDRQSVSLPRLAVTCAAPRGCRKDYLLLRHSTSRLICWMRICPILVFFVCNELHNASWKWIASYISLKYRLLIIHTLNRHKREQVSLVGWLWLK